MNANRSVAPDTMGYEGSTGLQRDKRSVSGKILPGAELTVRLSQLRHDLRLIADEDPRALEILREMGVLLARLGNYAGAIEAYGQIRKRAAALSDSAQEARSLEAMGSLYIRRHDYPAALECYLGCLRLQENTSDPVVAGTAWMQIGVIYGNMEDQDRALECFQRSAQIFEDAGKLFLMVKAVVNIANVLRSRGELDAALDHMLRALMIFEELGDRNNITEALAIIAAIYEKQKNLDVSLDYNNRALVMAESLGNSMLCATLLMSIGNIHRKKLDYPAALGAALRGLGMISELTNPILECQLNELAALVYEQTGDLSKALEHHKRFNRAREEYIQRKRDDVVGELRARFDVEQAERDRDMYRTQAWELRREVHDKTKELTAVTLSLVQKSEFLDQMKGQLADILASSKQRSEKIVTPVLDEIIAGADNEEGWNLFEQQFDRVHQDFMRTLAERYPSLTPMELKICALTKMDLSTKEIAKMLFVSVRNVQNHRYRLRKKLKLDPEANLVSFLTGI